MATALAILALVRLALVMLALALTILTLAFAACLSTDLALVVITKPRDFNSALSALVLACSR